MAAGLGIRTLLALFASWCVLRELEVGPLHHALSGPAFGKVAYWIVVVGSSLLTIWRGRSARAGERVAWMLIGTGALLWSLADVYWTLFLATQDSIPVPSVSDAGYLAMYPLVAAGFFLLLRSQPRRGASRTLWVDGVTAALAVGSLSAAVVMETVWHTLEGDAAGVLTNLAYPIGDLALLGVVIGAWALRGWRVDRTWALLAAAILLFWVADSNYLVTVANGTYSYPSIFDGGWTICILLFAVAAWQPRSEAAIRHDRTRLRFILWPAAFATLGLLVLVASAIIGLNPFAVGLAALSLFAALLRLVVSLRDNAAMLNASREEALTDSLTGLRNRRALMRDLADRLEDGTPSLLALFDLDGFKAYNDSFGHPAGDALLARLGTKLAAHVAGEGTAYRMGGDEFCVLVDAGFADAQDLAAAEALSEVGDGFLVRASHGSVRLPDETADPGEALRVVDQRMYARKNRGRTSARRQSSDVLLRALAERDPELSEHLSGVASLAESVAARLGLGEEAIEQVRHAAALHDVGKMAIPDAILGKPGPLDDAEWAFIRRHTLIGERIVAAAPSLHHVAPLVRSSHERWDGRGYPDALAGDQIPLGARIVAVCDSFDAMIADRPYRQSMQSDDAIAELRRCAGSQFDPDVVEAFVAAWDERVAPAVAA
jgi:two-component system, cell cycle response regulator